eukprot:1508440-Rhodomonas_salina.2
MARSRCRKGRTRPLRPSETPTIALHPAQLTRRASKKRGRKRASTHDQTLQLRKEEQEQTACDSPLAQGTHS